MASALESAQAIPDDLVSEILARFPPDIPEYLLRACLVCRSWIRLTSDPAFHGRLHELHGSPPVLGFLHDGDEPNFVRAIASPVTLASVPDRHSWRVVDYRHGRALYISNNRRVLLVWELLTGDKQRVQLPAACESDFPGAAVVCAARGCDHHGGCRGGHFQLALVFSDLGVFDYEEAPDEDDLITQACLFSSETSTWSNIISVNRLSGLFGDYSSVYAKECKIYFLTNSRNILEYDISAARLSILEPPCHDAAYTDKMILTVTSHGALAVAEQREGSLVLWSSELTDSGETNWVEMFSVPIGQFTLLGCTLTSSVSFVIFAGKLDGTYRIEFDSNGLKETKLCTEQQFRPLVPVCSFYTPKAPSLVLQSIEHERPVLPSTASEQVGQEREGGTELAQQFDIESVGVKRANDVDSEEPSSKRVAFTLM